MKKPILSTFAWVLTLALVLPVNLFAYDVPARYSKVKYFYVFGPDGNPLDGKEDSSFTLNVDVPVHSQDDVVLKIYDPDTGGRIDGIVGMEAGPGVDTVTRVTISGDRSLAEKEFGPNDFDGKWYEFGPFQPSQGKNVGNFYRFEVEVQAISGKYQNLFKISVNPRHADAWSDNITFRLLPDRGDVGFFYPEIPQGVNRINFENFDLDHRGGVGSLTDLATDATYEVADSRSGQWQTTPVSLEGSGERRLEYSVKTTFQRRGNAGLRVSDEQGNLYPIYFKKGKTKQLPKPARKKVAPPADPGPALSCNQFTFDARSSYDADNDKIEYLWEFGDGSSSTEPVVTHVYPKGGNYAVTLTVKDNSGLECETARTTQRVDVNTPPSANFSAPDLVCVNEKVTLDAGGSKDGESEELAYQWRFDDGETATGRRVTKTFDKGGVYKVNLTVDDGANSSCSLDNLSQVIHVNAAPVAKAGRDVSVCLDNPMANYEVSFDGSDSNDPDGDDLSYAWDFGDGDSGQGSRVKHVYTTGGEYTARLTVRDDSGSSCSVDADTVRVKLNKSPVAVAGKDRFACTGTNVRFSGSDSYGEEGQTLSYAWDFGDGETGTGRNVEHAYSRGGQYDVVLKVDDGSGSSCSDAVDRASVVINSAPSASLRTVEDSCVGDRVSFDASDSSDPDGDSLKYRWDFGDGTKEVGGASMSHKYAKGGTYRVKVEVDDGSGSPCGSDMASTRVVVNTPPVADAGPNLVCCQDQRNSFDGSGSYDADGDTLSYQWDFGDGTGDTGSAQVSHAYRENGTYKVALTVDDNSGTACSTSTSGFMANVNAKPVPVIKIKQN